MLANLISREAVLFGMRDGHTNVLGLIKSGFQGTNQTNVSRPCLSTCLIYVAARGVLIAAYAYCVTLARGIFNIRDHLCL